MKPATN